LNPREEEKSREKGEPKEREREKKSPLRALLLFKRGQKKNQTKNKKNERRIRGDA